MALTGLRLKFSASASQVLGPSETCDRMAATCSDIDLGQGCLPCAVRIHRRQHAGPGIKEIGLEGADAIAAALGAGNATVHGNH